MRRALFGTSFDPQVAVAVGGADVVLRALPTNTP